MRIAQLTSNFYSVPPRSSKAIFYMVHRLTEGLLAAGHDVTLFASGDSETAAKLIAVTENQTSDMGIPEHVTQHYLHLLISECYSRAKDFDVIHSHFNTTALPYARLTDVPTVHTLHTPISAETLPIVEAYKDQRFISFTHSQQHLYPRLNWVGNIYHGVDHGHLTFNAEPKDYLLFMGRIVPEKGVDVAIEAAKAAGMKLIIVGRTNEAHMAYFRERIEPHIDGVNIRFVGEATHETKVEFFRNAKALLFPVQWEEPFGLVMIEAMACGTPVIGFDRWSVAEIVQDQETGYVVRDLAGMVDAIGRIGAIDRAACRRRTERFFSYERMVSGYQAIYRRVAAGRS
jgi:glycosyltransferase involved in cell wall biosynthesis